MGKLEVVFDVGLAFPVMVIVASSERVAVEFSSTGNRVEIEVPEVVTPEDQVRRGPLFAKVAIHVFRECSDEQARDTQNIFNLHITSDAGRALWMLLETIRDVQFREPNATSYKSLAGYPVTRAEHIYDNPLVRGCEYRWIYEGNETARASFTGVPAIVITGEAWEKAIKRVAARQEVPVYYGFALDAAYFSKGDPLRTIIMACAAWETAMRDYLTNVASKRDPAYEIAGAGRGLAALYKFVRAAKGGPVFHDWIGPGTEQNFTRQMELINSLGSYRNKLLHEGERSIPSGVAADTMLAVLNAIDWLFS